MAWPGDVERLAGLLEAQLAAPVEQWEPETLSDADLATIAREPQPHGSPTPVDTGDRRTLWAIVLVPPAGRNVAAEGSAMGVEELVRRAQQRLRLGATLAGLAAGLVALAGSVAVSGLIWGNPALGATIGALLASGITLAAARRATVQWSSSNTAAHIEARTPGLDNLVVTASDLMAGLVDASERMRDEIVHQASARIGALSLPAVAPVVGSLWLLAAAAVGTLAVVWVAWTGRDPLTTRVSAVSINPRLQSILVTITPPAYLGRDVEQVADPEQVSVPAGGRLRVEVASDESTGLDRGARKRASVVGRRR